MRKTKIVCTIGPACADKETIREMIDVGMNVARLNFSHGNREWHRKCIKIIQEINAELEFPVATILDLQGPEIRTCNTKPVKANTGDRIRLVANGCENHGDNVVPINYNSVIEGIRPGDRVYIDDGMIECVAVEKQNGNIVCEVLNGGVIYGKKSVNIPGTHIRQPTLTEKDKKDIEFGLSLGIDYLALSFVRNEHDIVKVRGLVEEYETKIIAKIECSAAVENFDNILKVSDAIMLARGDLGVEIAFEKLPIIQKELIRKCNLSGKPIIVATHMLNSMIENPRPTRAEIIDVANAVLSGADAVMLSGETAIGKYPVEAVKVMDSIVREAENNIKPNFTIPVSDDVSEIVARAVANVSDSLNAKAIISFTETGNTAKNISKYRVRAPIFVFTPNQKLYKTQTLLWGTYFYPINGNSLNEMIERGIENLKKSGKVSSGDSIVLTAGMRDKETRSIAEVRVVD